MDWRRTLILLCGITLSACAAGKRGTPISVSPPAGAAGTSARPAAQSTRADAAPPAATGPLAYVDGQAVQWSAVRPALLEAAGGEVLTEYVLEQALRQRLASRQLLIDERQLDAERQIMLDLLAPDPDQAARLLRELRVRRGLGEARFRSLLWRNAALRLLVQPEVIVTEQALRQAYELEHGLRHVARLITVDSAAVAGQITAQARGGAAFVELVNRHSTDPTRNNGGLLPPVSPADATYPAALRRAMAQLTPNQVSDPIALEQGFAILRLEATIAPDGVDFAQVRGQLEVSVRREMERMLMARLVRTTLDDADVTVLDPQLSASWQQARKQAAAAP